MPELKFKVFAIHGIGVSHLPSVDSTALASSLVSAGETASWWTDENGFRYSIAKCTQLLDHFVIGILTQQHRVDRHLYDDEKRESLDDTDSYEDRIFILDISEGRIHIEWRQFRSKPPLSLSLMIRRFEDILTDVFLKIGSDRVNLSAFEFETTKEEFVSIFYNNRILRISIDDVGQQFVPLDIQLVNPNPHLEGALRDLLLHDAALDALNNIEAEVKENGNGDLRRSAIARGALHSGAPLTVRYQRPDGNIRIRHKNENGIFSVSIPTTSLDTVQEKIEIVTSVIDAINGVDLQVPEQGQIQDLSNLDLFNEE